jgi:hypothetical protein
MEVEQKINEIVETIGFSIYAIASIVDLNRPGCGDSSFWDLNEKFFIKVVKSSSILNNRLNILYSFCNRWKKENCKINRLMMNKEMFEIFKYFMELLLIDPIDKSKINKVIDTFSSYCKIHTDETFLEEMELKKQGV